MNRGTPDEIPSDIRDLLLFGVTASILLNGSCAEQVKPRIAVVGLGFAGLELMDNLTKSGKFEVFGIEARDRLGGRVYTTEEGDEFGAAWVHGTYCDSLNEINPVFIKAQQAGCEYFATNGMKAYSSDGSPLQCHKKLWDQMWNALNNIKTSPESIQNAFRASNDSIYNYISTHFTDVFGGISGKNVHAVIKAVREWQSYYAGNWDELSIGSMAVDKEYDGEQLIIKNGGYKRLIDIYERDILQNGGIIMTGTVVAEINHTDDGVRITVRGTEEILSFDTVVVTVPLGVLKKGLIKFEPALPKWKRRAINKLGFGVYDKVFVEFTGSIEREDHGFWPARTGSVLIVPKADDDCLEYDRFIGSKSVPLDFEPRAYDKREDDHIGIEMVNLSAIAGKPKLVMLIYGHAAVEMEKIADNPEKLAEFARKKLENAFPKRVPTITRVYATTWGSDEFAGGSFANIPRKASGMDMITLSRPVGKNLLFAGEATFPLHYSTVHGALKSGRREFARLVKIYYPEEITEFDNLLA